MFTNINSMFKRRNLKQQKTENTKKKIINQNEVKLNKMSAYYGDWRAKCTIHLIPVIWRQQLNYYLRPGMMRTCLSRDHAVLLFLVSRNSIKPFLF